MNKKITFSDEDIIDSYNFTNKQLAKLPKAGTDTGERYYSETEKIILKCYKNGHKAICTSWLKTNLNIPTSTGQYALERLKQKGHLKSRIEWLKIDGIKRRLKMYYKKSK